MKILSYLFVLALIVVNHFLLPGWWQIPVWCVLGLWLSLPRWGLRRSFFGHIVVPEILIATGFALFYRSRIGAGYAHFSEFVMPWWGWIGLVITVNVITALLCMYTFFCIGRLLNYKLKNNPEETVII